MPARQRGPLSTLATPQKSSQLDVIAKSINASTPSTTSSSSTFETGVAVVAFFIAAVLLNYLGGATSSLLSRIVGTWASESLRYVLLALASYGTLYGWHKRNKGGEAAAVWAGAALFTVLMHRLLAASAAIFLNKGSEYIQSANDTEILARWALTALFGCGGAFFLLGWALGNALYAMPAALYAPGLCSIPIIIAVPSLAAVYPYYHQCIANPVVSTFSAVMATTYLYAISAPSSAAAAARTHSNSVHKWRMQGQIMCLFLLFTSYRSISACLHCGDFTSTSTMQNKRNSPSTLETRPSRTGCTWRCSLQDGSLLSIIENSPEENPVLRYRIMRLNHAVMGGIWILPEQEAGRPVYTTFHLQAAARLLLSDKEDVESSNNQKISGNEQRNTKNIAKQRRQRRRSLHIGLGAGTAVSLLQRRGFVTDVIEIYPEIIDAAQTHFNLNIRTNDINNTSTSNEAEIGIAIAGDALKVVPSLKDRNYDLVILDVFSGGFPTSSDSSFFKAFFYPSNRRSGKESKETEESVFKLSSAAFFEEIKRKIKNDSSDGDGSIDNGVLAVNYVGMQDSPELAQLVCKLKRVFASVRCFKDAEGGGGEEKLDEQNKGKQADSNTQGPEKQADRLGNFVIMATDNSNAGAGTSTAGTAAAGTAAAKDLFSSAQREILELRDGPLDEMEVDVFSRLAKSEVSVAWATRDTCKNVLGGGEGQGKKVVKGAAQRSHRALAGLHNAAAHWRTMRVQFGDEVWTL